MEGLFVMFTILAGLVMVLIAVGAIVHTVMFGTIFGLLVKRFAEAAHQQSVREAAQAPLPCAYCGVTIPAGGDQCPGCGAKR